MKVIVCVNDSKESQLALENAVEFVNGTNFELTLLHALKQKVNHEGNDIIQESSDDTFEKSEELLKNLKEYAEDMLGENANINNVILGSENADPVSSIIEYVNSKDIEQVFIGHRAMDKKHERLYGSFAKEMISKSPVPVVVTTTNGSE